MIDTVKNDGLVPAMPHAVDRRYVRSNLASVIGNQMTVIPTNNSVIYGARRDSANILLQLSQIKIQDYS